jgi:hypothetical protein
VHVAIADIRRVIDTIESSMQAERPLNERGELQQHGPLLDAAIAHLCTLQEIRREYGKGRAEMDGMDLHVLPDVGLLAAWLAQDHRSPGDVGPRGVGRRDALLRSRAQRLIDALNNPDRGGAPHRARPDAEHQMS